MRDEPTGSAPGVAAAPADSLVGQVLAGKFAVEERLGAGAMGVVYRARQLALERTVAIKVLHRELATDSEFADRFGREARAASRLDHPNSIRIFDFGQDADGLLYIAMEYVEGSDLFALVSQRGALAAKGIVDILGQVLAALAMAHDMGVIHRDLKPENIMIVRGKGDDGQPIDTVKVCDFGIAKMLGVAPVADGQPRRRLSTTGLIVGTPAYMSPEQARGEPQDARSDVYAVGVVLYELLTGRVPFDAETSLAVALKHVSDEPAAPSAQAAGVDPDLEAICLRALRKRPSERYQSAREMRLALHSAANRPGFGARARPTLGRIGAPNLRARFDSSKPTLVGVAPPGGVPRVRRSRGWLALLLIPAASLFVLLRQRHERHEHAAPALSLSPAASAGALSAAAAGALSVTLPEPPSTSAVAPAALSAVARGSGVAPPSALVGAPLVVSLNAAMTTQTASAAVSPSAGPPGVSPSASGTTRSVLALDNGGLATTENQAGGSSVASAAPAAEPEAPPPPAALPALGPTQVAARAPVPPVAPREPTYDLSAARVVMSTAKNAVGATALSVTRAVSGAATRITACYKSALPRLRGVIEGAGLLHVDTDGAGVITEARLSGPVQGSVATCVAAAVQGLRVANVDTGSASADVPLAFRAH